MIIIMSLFGYIEVSYVLSNRETVPFTINRPLELSLLN